MHRQSTPVQLPLFVLDKRCARCGAVKDREQFSTDRREKDGKNRRCRACLNAPRHADVPLGTLKICPACGERKPLSAFHARRNTRDGHGPYCKSCACAVACAWRACHPGAVRAAFRAWEALHREERRAYARRWREKNKERVRTWRRAAYQRNPQSVKDRVAAWYRAHPLERRLHCHHRRQRLRRAGGRLRPADVLLLIEVQRGRCAYCGRCLTEGYHLEHLTPLARGGAGHLHNIALACRRCNDRKATRTAGEFLAHLLKERRTAR